MAGAVPGSAPVMTGPELTSDNVERAVLQVNDHYHYHHHHHDLHYQLLFQFYQTTATPDQLQETHKWLTLAQLSPQAWNFCWDLIQADKKHEVQFFGASCLAVKVRM